MNSTAIKFNMLLQSAVVERILLFPPTVKEVHCTPRTSTLFRVSLPDVSELVAWDEFMAFDAERIAVTSYLFFWELSRKVSRPSRPVVELAVVLPAGIPDSWHDLTNGEVLIGRALTSRGVAWLNT